MESYQSVHGEFKRGLGLIDSTMIVVGSMIGSGIFIVSADIARTVGSAGYLLVVWLLSGVMTMICALSYGELAGMMPRVGGQYAYLREAYNPLIGFLYGWTMFLVIQTGTIAAVGVAFAKFTGVLFPWFSEKHILLEIGSFKISAAQILSIVSIILLTAINIRGLKTGKIIQNIFTGAKILALLGLIILGFFVASNSSAIAANFSHLWNMTWTHIENGKINFVETISGPMIFIAIGVAMVGALFSSDAWNNITFTAGEVINPKKNIPLSLALGVFIVTIIYLLVNVSYLVILPLAGTPNAADVAGRGIQFAAADRVGVAAATGIFGASAASIMAILIMISTFGCNNGLILAGGRLFYAMSDDELFFKRAGRLNAQGVPAWALVAQCIWTSILCVSGTYGDLLDYVIFAVLIFYILTIAGIFILRRKQPNVERPYKAFGYPIVPIIYIILAAAICIDLLIFKPRYSWPGLVIVVLGIPVFYFWELKKKYRSAKI